MNCRGAAPKGAASFCVGGVASFFMPVELFLFMSGELLLFLAWRRLFPRLVLWSVDCCNRALRGISKGAVRSRAELPEVDCCNGALRGISKGAMASGTCQLRRSRYRVSVLENYRPRKKDKTTYPHQSADQVIKD